MNSYTIFALIEIDICGVVLTLLKWNNYKHAINEQFSV